LLLKGHRSWAELQTSERYKLEEFILKLVKWTDITLIYLTMSTGSMSHSLNSKYATAYTLCFACIWQSIPLRTIKVYNGIWFSTARNTWESLSQIQTKNIFLTILTSVMATLISTLFDHQFTVANMKQRYKVIWQFNIITIYNSQWKMHQYKTLLK